MNRALPALLTFALASAGCARDDTVYPSLAPRAVEKLGFAEPGAPPPAPVVADPDLDVEIAAAGARIDKAAGDFTHDAAAVELAARAARGAAAGSEAWIAAQTSLAGLDALRAELSEVLANLEQLAIDRARTLAPDYPALEAVRARARAELAREEAAIDRIGSALTPA